MSDYVFKIAEIQTLVVKATSEKAAFNKAKEQLKAMIDAEKEPRKHRIELRYKK